LKKESLISLDQELVIRTFLPHEFYHLSPSKDLMKVILGNISFLPSKNDRFLGNFANAIIASKVEGFDFPIAPE
jgi:hypothetical protein